MSLDVNQPESLTISIRWLGPYANVNRSISFWRNPDGGTEWELRHQVQPLTIPYIVQSTRTWCPHSMPLP